MTRADEARARTVIAAAAVAGGVTPEQVLGDRRHRPVAEARHVAAAVIRDTTDLSYPAIARILGGRDHTTIMHSVRVVAANPDLTARAGEVRAHVLGQLVFR